MKQRLKLKIHGEVQGVFFRSGAKKKADELRLVGWVKNDVLGTVSILAEGEKVYLEDFLSWCEQGSCLGSVKKIDKEWGVAEGNFSSFEIIR